MQGFIIKTISNDYYVYSNNIIYACKARGQFKNNNITPLCGDDVIFEYDSIAKYGLITTILPRKNNLVRPSVANVDLALIVMSTIEPSFDSYLVDKLIVCATLEGIEPILIVNKCEFLIDSLKCLLENYKKAGYIVIESSAKNMINIEKIHEIIANKKVVLCGQSAVGKSSIINALHGNDIKNVGSYSEKLGRGRHETREVEFLKINDCFIADTPGFSRLDIKEDLTCVARAFKDFNLLANKCKYNTCLHKDEPNCAVKEAVNNGTIDKRRYDNYLHLLSEIKDGKKVWRKK